MYMYMYYVVATQIKYNHVLIHAIYYMYGAHAV